MPPWFTRPGVAARSDFIISAELPEREWPRRFKAARRARIDVEGAEEDPQQPQRTISEALNDCRRPA